MGEDFVKQLKFSPSINHPLCGEEIVGCLTEMEDFVTAGD